MTENDRALMTGSLLLSTSYIFPLNKVIKLGGFKKFYYLCLLYGVKGIALYELKTLKVR